MSLNFTDVIEHLRAILLARVHKHLAQRSSIRLEFWNQPNFLLLNLGEIAHILTGRDIRTDEDVKASLFEPAAFELLTSKCPSEYWFFELLLRVRLKTLPVTAQDISLAIDEARKELLSKHDVSFLTQGVEETHSIETAHVDRIFPLHQAGLLLSPGPKLSWSDLVVHPLVKQS